MRDFEKCLFLGLNYSNLFWSLAPKFRDREAFYFKMQNFEEKLKELSFSYKWLVIKKNYLNPFVEAN